MLSPSGGLEYVSPESLAGELAGVSSALIMPMPAAARMSAVANAIRSLLMAALSAPMLARPDADGQWAISRNDAQMTVLGEEWSITARCAAGQPEYVQLMADDLLMSFDYSVPTKINGDVADMHASLRTSDGEHASYTYYADGRTMDDDDWSSAAADDINAADDADSLDDSMPGSIDNGDLLRRTVTVAGAAAAAAALGGMIKKMATSGTTTSATSTPAPSAPPAHSPAIDLNVLLWHYVVAGQTQSPVGDPVLRERLAHGELPEETLVWNPQLPNWTTALAAGLVARPAIQPVVQPVVQPAPPLAGSPAVAKPEPEALWHYAVDGKPLGPVDERSLRDQLAQGALPGDTLVWNPKLPEWCKASAAGLIVYPAEKPVPPPTPAPFAPLATPIPAPPVQLKCTRCQQALPPGLKFCTGCGQAVTATEAAPAQRCCPRCATVLAPTDRFCTGCGSPQ